MRKILAGLGSLLFSIIGPIAVLAAVIFFLFSTPTFIEAALDQSKIYDSIVNFVNQAVTQNLPSSGQTDSIKEAVQQVLNTQYIKSKVDDFLDQSFAYAKNQTNDLPAVSLSDLKDKLGETNPVFKQLPAQALDVLDKKYELPENIAAYLREGANILLAVLTTSGIASIMLLFLLFSWGANLAERFSLVAWALLKVTIPELIVLGIGLYFAHRTTSLPFGLPENIKFLQDSIWSLTQYLTENILTDLIYAYGALAVAGIIFWSMSRSLKNRA